MLVALIVVSVSLNRAPSFTLFEPNTQAHGISRNGRFVCGTWWEGNSWLPVVWDGKSMVSTRATFSTADHEKAVAVSDNGDAAVVVTRKDEKEFSRFYGYRWNRGRRPAALATLPGYTESWPRAMSADGSIVAGTCFSDTDNYPVTWDSAGKIQKLPVPNGLKKSRGEALGMTGDGKIIVGRQEGPHGLQGVVWNQGRLSFLDYVPKGHKEAYAWVSSRDGSIVAGFSKVGDRTLPAIWDKSKAGKLLGAMPPRFKTGMARGISDDGNTIVGLWGYDKTADGFVWQRGGSVVTVGDFLSKKGLTAQIAGLKFVNVMAITADGRTFVGMCKDPEGRSRGFRASY